MGNLQNNICMKAATTPHTSPLLQNKKSTKHSKLSFTKPTPKFMWTEHHINWADIDDDWDPEMAEQQPMHTVKQFDKKSTKFIQQIKIKWNTFIKMKKKNFQDDYQVITQIGKGGYGTIYKVQAKYTGVLRAAKIIKKTTLAQDDLERLLIEMSIMIDLDHPNIARLFEVYDYKLHFVLIVELCEGGELFKKIALRKMDQDEISEIMVQLLRALQYLHSRGIIHRDLKPENILFEKNTNNIKLIDFGIATRYKKGQQPLTTRVGTPFYIAPEVLCKCYTEKCDVWSVGIIFYMMVNSKPPFNGQDEIQIMHNILATDANFRSPPFSQVSKQYLNLLTKLMTKNPEQRPSAFQAYNHPYIQDYIAKTTAVVNYDNVLNTISSFNFSNRLQAVVLTFIVSQILTSEQKKDMKQVFQYLDKDHDGVLNLSEFRLAFSGRKDMSEKRIGALMRRIDTNGSGSIEFTQFIVAALGSEQYTTIHFEEAFEYFDINHSASFLQNQQHSETQIRKLFESIDENEDGLISKQQFLHVLSRKDAQTIEGPKRMDVHPVKPARHK